MLAPRRVSLAPPCENSRNPNPWGLQGDPGVYITKSYLSGSECTAGTGSHAMNTQHCLSGNVGCKSRTDLLWGFSGTPSGLCDEGQGRWRVWTVLSPVEHPDLEGVIVRIAAGALCLRPPHQSRFLHLALLPLFSTLSPAAEQETWPIWSLNKIPSNCAVLWLVCFLFCRHQITICSCGFSWTVFLQLSLLPYFIFVGKHIFVILNGFFPEMKYKWFLWKVEKNAVTPFL